VLALIAAVGQGFAAEQVFSLGGCADAGACGSELGRAGLVFAAALVLGVVAGVLLGMTTGFVAVFCGSFLGSGIGALIAAADGGGLGAWIVGVTFVLTALLLAGGSLLIGVLQQRIVNQLAEEMGGTAVSSRLVD
jgi:hypothetical protein